MYELLGGGGESSLLEAHVAAGLACSLRDVRSIDAVETHLTFPSLAVGHMKEASLKNR